MRARLEAGVLGIIALGLILALGEWAVRVLPRRAALTGLGQVAGLDGLARPSWAWPILGALLLLAVLGLIRHPGLRSPRWVTLLVLLSLLAFAGPIGVLVGQHLLILAVAALLGLLIGLQPPVLFERAAPKGLGLLLWALVTAVHATFAIHRDQSYGSGSWDHGCMVHNFYRASRFLSSTSTVLGDVDFLGDHFMIGIYLYAPIFWAWASSTTVLLIQAINVGAAAPAIYGIARHRGVSWGHAALLALVTGLSFGMQSAAYFDSHELTVGLGFLAFGILAFETERLGWATVLLGLFMLFKESLGAYVVALGLLSVWRGVKRKDARHLKYGALWIGLGLVWFVLVNRVFMPALIASAPNKPEPHETFGDFGPTVFQAAVGIFTHPLKAMGAVFVPEEKLLSHAVWFSGVGGLLILAPEIGIAALPLVAERFLSSKATMWEMGYHYGAPLALYAGWAAALGWARALRWVEAGLGQLDPALAPRARWVLPIYVLTAALLTTGVGYRSPSNYWRWDLVYFAPPARRSAHDQAVRLLRGLGRDARLSVQNRILPHLADRPVIYRLGDWNKADYVLLSVGENAWPWDDGYAGRLAKTLSRDPAWRLIYAQEATAVFARVAVTELPAVPPTPALGL